MKQRVSLLDEIWMSEIQVVKNDDKQDSAQGLDGSVDAQVVEEMQLLKYANK